MAGKRVVRLDCYCKEVKAVPRSHSSSTIGDDEDEDKSLLSSSSGYHVSKVSTDEVSIMGPYNMYTSISSLGGPQCLCMCMEMEL